MNVFFDTSVLVAPSVADHPHHARSLPALQRVTMCQDKGFIGTHSIAESYAALTCMPVVPRLHPSEAGRLIRDFIPKTCGVVTVDMTR